MKNCNAHEKDFMNVSLSQIYNINEFFKTKKMPDELTSGNN